MSKRKHRPSQYDAELYMEYVRDELDHDLDRPIRCYVCLSEHPDINDVMIYSVGDHTVVLCDACGMHILRIMMLMRQSTTRIKQLLNHKKRKQVR